MFFALSLRLPFITSHVASKTGRFPRQISCKVFSPKSLLLAAPRPHPFGPLSSAYGSARCLSTQSYFPHLSSTSCFLRRKRVRNWGRECPTVRFGAWTLCRVGVRKKVEYMIWILIDWKKADWYFHFPVHDFTQDLFYHHWGHGNDTIIQDI